MSGILNRKYGADETYAFCNLYVDARAGRNVLAGDGEGDLDVLGKHGRSQSQDCKEGFHRRERGEDV